MRNFKIYFGPSKSNRFRQVMEAVEGRPDLKVINRNNSKKLYYELTVDESDIDFLAFISKLSYGLGYNRLPEKWFKEKFQNNAYVGPGEFYEKHEELLRVLLRHGYAKVIDHYGNLGYSDKRPPDPVRNYEVIRSAIENRDYETALALYYKNLGNEYFGPLHPELVYLKRLAGTELTGRDLLYCRPKSSMDPFLAENIEAYVKTIDAELKKRRSDGKPTPADVLVKEAPSIQEIKKDIKERVRRAVRVSPLGQIYRFELPTLQSPSAYCREGEVKAGRLFSEFPNPFLCTRRYIFKNELIERPMVSLSPVSHRKLVIDKGYEVAKLEECFFRKSKKVRLKPAQFKRPKEKLCLDRRWNNLHGKFHQAQRQNAL